MAHEIDGYAGRMVKEAREPLNTFPGGSQRSDVCFAVWSGHPGERKSRFCGWWDRSNELGCRWPFPLPCYVHKLTLLVSPRTGEAPFEIQVVHALTDARFDAAILGECCYYGLTWAENERRGEQFAAIAELAEQGENA